LPQRMSIPFSSCARSVPAAGRIHFVRENSATHFLRRGHKGHVRFGTKADICGATSHVRFTPNCDCKSGYLRFVMSALPPKADIPFDCISVLCVVNHLTKTSGVEAGTLRGVHEKAEVSRTRLTITTANSSMAGYNRNTGHTRDSRGHSSRAEE
jgi:hypothetical protein